MAFTAHATPGRPEADRRPRSSRCAVRRGFGALTISLSAFAALAGGAQAASVDLATARTFSVLGGSTVTNTGPTVLGGDLGLAPGTMVTGFPPGTVGGTAHVNDAVALQAQSDLTTAYNDAAGRPSTATVTGDLAGRRLPGGVYTSASSLGLTGDLTLDAGGDPNAVFVFQAGSTLTTASGSRVLLTGGAQACNVFWQVGSSATIGTATTFVGNILALTSVSLTTAATIDGSALARNGAVTLDTNTVTRSACTTGTPIAPTPTGPAPTGPEPTATTVTTAPATTGAPAARTQPAATKTGTTVKKTRRARRVRNRRPRANRPPRTLARPPRTLARPPRTPFGFTG